MAESLARLVAVSCEEALWHPHLPYRRKFTRVHNPPVIILALWAVLSSEVV